MHITNEKMLFFKKRIFSHSKKIIDSIKELQDRTEAIETNNKENFSEKVNSMIFDEKDLISKNQEIQKKAKQSRSVYVNECNMLAAHIVQFDNTLEQLFIFVLKKEDKVIYKNMITECGIEESVANSLNQIRKLRNTMCHSYAFHNFFSDMSHKKLNFLKYAFISAKVTAVRTLIKMRLKEEIFQPGFILSIKNDIKVLKSKKTVWLSF